jgi:hypothetical protein
LLDFNDKIIVSCRSEIFRHPTFQILELFVKHSFELSYCKEDHLEIAAKYLASEYIEQLNDVIDISHFRPLLYVLYSRNPNSNLSEFIDWSKMFSNFSLFSVFWNSLKNDDISIQPLYNIHKNNTQNWVGFNWASRFHSCVYILKGLSINSDRFELGFLEYKTYSRGLKWEMSMTSFNCSMYSDARYLAAWQNYSFLSIRNLQTSNISDIRAVC